MKIILDANFIIAVLDSTDSCHKRALAISGALEQGGYELILNNVVFYEVLTVLCRRGVKDLAEWYYNRVTGAQDVILLYCNDTLEKRSFFYFTKMASKNISFTDCTLFAAADAHYTKHIVSFDKQLQSQKDFSIIHDSNQLS